MPRDSRDSPALGDFVTRLARDTRIFKNVASFTLCYCSLAAPSVKLYLVTLLEDALAASTLSSRKCQLATQFVTAMNAYGANYRNETSRK